MNNADILSILINLAVGFYFAVIYPRSLSKRFGSQPAPRGFVLLQRVVPPVGWMIMLLTLIYVVSLLLDGGVQG
jgi:hypothetical protein